MDQHEIFEPPQHFRDRATINSLQHYQRMGAEAAADPEKFWAEQGQHLDWFAPWSKILDWSHPPLAKWFTGGKLNACYNCVDRHANTWRRNKAAIIWEGENYDQRILTYQELYRKVSKFANTLKSLGLKLGDKAVIYMPMVPEAAIAMLACARLGIIHSVVFDGFSAEALRDRIQDIEADLVITADRGLRRGRETLLKQNVDEALKECPSVRHVIVHRRMGAVIRMYPGRDYWWEDLTVGIEETCPCEPVDAEHPIFVLHTSGTTGKPRGIVHSTGGYLTQVLATMSWVFDLRDDDTYWCTADIGTITAHSYIVYGPLAAGATVLMYEGASDWPAHDRLFRLIEKYRVSIFFTFPSEIRNFVRQGEDAPRKHDLSSLRLLASTGECLNSALWKWFYRVVGKERCPVVDAWWQTETGGIMIAPVPGATPTKPGSASLPLPGVSADVVNENGERVKSGRGYLVLKAPWPGMLREIHKDPTGVHDRYWRRFPGAYFTGDAVWRDDQGYFWILGRVDDVINVAGHRFSTMELESALVRHEMVAGAAVICAPHQLRGQCIHAFVSLKKGMHGSDAVEEALRDWVAEKIGPMARPERVHFVEALPTTRSGKIMRRLLRELIATHAISGDTSTLEDFEVLLKLSQHGKSEEEILKRRAGNPTQV